ncbi:hypothetical protein BHY07_03505 [Bacillus subtilis subsp. subtilis]|nr:hypothetical protein QU35_03515 [Bacillus subtilis subsp. subtilis str. 168]AIY96208.1 hypothetical protein QX56_03510 [Bacillus subtilis]AJE93275.1 hypothetical protein RP72_03395 [Bacillus subtilis subsp. subtilis]AKC46149.1 hypothetical protein O7A_03510 [Bacillus subtilis KCTC 1028 = ATCC 6051a]EXF51857.1 hypothetical protein Y647_20090 [Bacillus subtilis QH-1]
MTGIERLWKALRNSWAFHSQMFLNVFLKSDPWMCLRLSGTEPKIKFYFRVDESLAETRNPQRIEKEFMELVE